MSTTTTKQDKPRKKWTAVAVAHWTGYTDTRIRQFEQEGIIPPKNENGEYALRACIIGIINHLKLRADQGTKQLSEERERNLKVRTQREEVKYLKEIGQLVNYVDVMKLFTLIVGTYRDNRRGTATRIAPTLSEEIVHRCKALFTRVLDQGKLDKKDADRLLRTLETEINEQRLRDTLTELLKEKINAENNAHLTELADAKLIRDAFPEPIKHGTVTSAEKKPKRKQLVRGRTV